MGTNRSKSAETCTESAGSLRPFTLIPLPDVGRAPILSAQFCGQVMVCAWRLCYGYEIRVGRLAARPLRLLTSQQCIIFNQNYSYVYELIDQIRAQRSCPLASARTVTRTQTH